MSDEIAVLKASRNQVAIRYGLPPVGALLVNQHGIEWLVDGHLYLSTLASIARCGVDCADTEVPQDLYPVILPQNLSPGLTEFIAETSRCTSKSIMPVDTMPSLRPSNAHPESYSIDGQTSPYRIIVFLDAAHVNETIFAHEIGHIWIDLVEDCEDYRILKDLSNPARVFQWTNLQSFVLDLKVNEVLREKGFDMSIIEGPVEEALASLSLAILTGYRPPEPREAVFLATTLASAMLEQEKGAADTLQSLDMAAMVFQRDLPGVYELACHLVASVRNHGYNNRASIRKAIDECATLSFSYIGEPLDLDRDLVEETPEECYEDKYPEWFPGLPVAAKLEIGKAMARQRIPAGTEYRLSYTPGGSVQIQFTQASGVWTEPTMLHHAHRLPHDVAFAGRSRSLPRGSAMMNKPVTPSVSVQQPTLPPFNNVPGRRTYAPGLAVFLSRVRLEEQLGGEHPYGYAMNNPVNYIDPTGLVPCSPYTCDTYPGGPCAYAKSRGDDHGQFGGVICCNGKKITCVWKNPGAYPGMGKCVGVHEGTHTGQVDCPPTGYIRPPWSHPGDANKNECNAYLIGMACLIAEQKKDCSKLIGNAKNKCNADYMDRMCKDCDLMKTQYLCPTLPPICSRCP